MTGLGSVEVQAASYQRCAACGSQFADTDASPTCASCGGLLEVVHAPPSARGAALRGVFSARRMNGIAHCEPRPR